MCAPAPVPALLFTRSLSSWYPPGKQLRRHAQPQVFERLRQTFLGTLHVHSSRVASAAADAIEEAVRSEVMTMSPLLGTERRIACTRSAACVEHIQALIMLT